MRKQRRKNYLNNKKKKKLCLERPVLKPTSDTATKVDFEGLTLDSRADYVKNIKQLLEQARVEIEAYPQLCEDIHDKRFKLSSMYLKKQFLVFRTFCFLSYNTVEKVNLNDFKRLTLGIFILF